MTLDDLEGLNGCVVLCKCVMMWARMSEIIEEMAEN